jgi:hypothetical protein
MTVFSSESLLPTRAAQPACYGVAVGEVGMAVAVGFGVFVAVDVGVAGGLKTGNADTLTPGSILRSYAGIQHGSW